MKHHRECFLIGTDTCIYMCFSLRVSIKLFSFSMWWHYRETDNLYYSHSLLHLPTCNPIKILGLQIS